MAYPATFDIGPTPQQFDKAQVALRIVIIIVVAWLMNGVIYSAGYLLLPAIAAILISQKGGEKYLAEAEQGPVKWLRYAMMFYSYIALATDKLSTEKPEEIVKLEVHPSGTPTVGNALMRIILAIPHAIILGFLFIAFFVVWVIAAFSILSSGKPPEWAEDFIRGYLRWNARLLAYMASLVDEYPPFSFSDDGSPAATAA
jgi:hypothetical protein